MSPFFLLEIRGPDGRRACLCLAPSPAAQGFAVLRGLLCSGLLATCSGPGQLGAGMGSPFMLSAVPCTLGMETATALLADVSPVSSAV